MHNFVSIEVGSAKVVGFHVRRDAIKPMKDQEENNTAPTIFSFLDGVRQWGNFAQITPPAVTITQAAECIGRTYMQAREVAKMDPIVDVKGNVFYSIEWDGKAHLISPTVIIGSMLNSFCQWATHKVLNIVAAVPPTWGKEQKKALMMAAKIYRKNIFILSTRVAHVYDYIIRNRESNPKGLIALFDFGETHFDASVYDIGDKIQCKSKKLIRRGGRDITNALSSHVIDRIKKEIQDEEVLATIKLIEEKPSEKDAVLFRYSIKKLKEDLSTSTSIVFTPSRIAHGDKISVSITREEFDSLQFNQDMGNEIKSLITAMQTESSLDTTPILSFQGGSSLIPFYRKIIADCFHVDVDNLVKSISPTECFAEGAAFFRMRKNREVHQVHQFIIEDDEMDELRRQEDEINDYYYSKQDLEEIKKGLKMFHYKLKRLIEHPQFSTMYEGETVSELYGLFAFISDFMDNDFETLTDVKKASEKLQDWTRQYKSISGKSKIIVPRKNKN